MVGSSKRGTSEKLLCENGTKWSDGFECGRGNWGHPPVAIILKGFWGG